MSFTYYVIKDEDLSGKLKNDNSMIDYVYGPERKYQFSVALGITF